MTVKSILVPTDFSEPSDAALSYATDMARTFGAQLYLLHVPGKTGENLELNFPVGRFETAARQRLDTLLSQSDIERLRPEYALQIGAPAEEIVRYAEARDIDLIIMGTHGRRGVAHLLLGSVAEQVVRTAPCPVLLVRQRKTAAVKAEATIPVAGTAAPLRTGGPVRAM
jgi:nucleotide-binding universal stress UspA family protein